MTTAGIDGGGHQAPSPATPGGQDVVTGEIDGLRGALLQHRGIAARLWIAQFEAWRQPWRRAWLKGHGTVFERGRGLAGQGSRYRQYREDWQQDNRKQTHHSIPVVFFPERTRSLSRPVAAKNIANATLAFFSGIAKRALTFGVQVILSTQELK